MPLNLQLYGDYIYNHSIITTCHHEAWRESGEVQCRQLRMVDWVSLPALAHHTGHLHQCSACRIAPQRMIDCYTPIQTHVHTTLNWPLASVLNVKQFISFLTTLECLEMHINAKLCLLRQSDWIRSLAFQMQLCESEKTDLYCQPKKCSPGTLSFWRYEISRD